MTKENKEVLRGYENLGCKFYEERGVVNPVDCYRYRRETRGYCERCGWNPIVNRKRQVEMFGEAQTRYNEEHSRIIREEDRLKYGKGGDTSDDV